MMALGPGKTRIIITVEQDVVEDVRRLLVELGLRREYLSTLLNDSLKAQRVALGRLVEVKRRGQDKRFGMGEFTSLLFDVVGDLKEVETEEEKAGQAERAPRGASARTRTTDPARPAEGPRGDRPDRKRGGRRRPPASRKTNG